MRNTVLRQFLLEDTTLSIRPVQNGIISIRTTLQLHHRLNLLQHHLSFLHIRVSLRHQNLLTPLLLREHLLVNPMFILVYQTVSRLHNRLCRAVVLFQFEKLTALILVLKRQDIIYIRTTETVNALSIITHHTHLLSLLRQQPYDPVLRIISVLIFIH